MLDHPACIEMANGGPTIAQPKTLLSQLSRNNLHKLLFHKVKLDNTNSLNGVRSHNNCNTKPHNSSKNVLQRLEGQTNGTIHNPSNDNHQSINVDGQEPESNRSSVETIPLGARKTSLGTDVSEGSSNSDSFQSSQARDDADDEYESGSETIEQQSEEDKEKDEEKDEFILESLRHVVRVCTNSQSSKKINSKELLKILDDVYIKTNQHSFPLVTGQLAKAHPQQANRSICQKKSRQK